MKRFLRGWAWVPVVAAVILAADRLSKEWIRANIPLNGSIAPIPALEPWFNIVHWYNTGAAFGILQGQGGLFVVIALVVIVAVLIYLRYLPANQWGVRLCLGLQMGGALGNLWDRIQFGHVTDFVLLSLPVGGRVFMWPAFNVADSSIVVGVILLAIILMREESRKPAPAAPAPTHAETQPENAPPAAEEARQVSPR